MSHRLTEGLCKKTYDSSTDFFEQTASREKFKSIRFMELMLLTSANTSTRKAAQLLNRIRHEAKGIGATTYRNTIEREGQKMQSHINQKCNKALHDNGFAYDGELLENTVFTPDQPEHIDHKKVAAAAAKLKIVTYEASEYELPETTVNVSIDGVGVKRQTETRPRDETCPQPKYVNNTVVHVQGSTGEYILNAETLCHVMKLLIGFLFHNNLARRQIVIFADGARDIHNAVAGMLSFLNYKVILDWYHLQKKCYEQLSLALNGSKIRNAFANELLPCLWFGNVDRAIGLLRGIDPGKVKNNEIIVSFIGYLERVRTNIPCYALRDELGLRNSSNRGEKANDLVVSGRQKHNGMSWSDDGSVAFASVASASHNEESDHWLRFNSFRFELRPVDKPVDKAA